MYINLKRTLKAIDTCLPDGVEPSGKQLHQMYESAIQLFRQVLGVIYDCEAFDIPTGQEPLPYLKKPS